MKMPAATADAPRAYRQTTRAAAAEATARRIIEALQVRLQALWFDEIRLEDVARDAGVTVQTIIRRFGSKEGLLAASSDVLAVEVMEGRGLPVGDAAGAVRAVIADYEVIGDLVMRILAQEERYAPLRAQGDRGRAGHREWVALVFAPWLEGLDPEASRRRLDALVVATDLYVWKLMRRDMQRPVEELQALMQRLVDAALA